MTERQGRLLSAGVIPVIVLDDASRAHDVGHALVSGGLSVAEVTLRSMSALDSLRAMARNEELLVGAGTVLSVEQVDAAVDAGAQFIVSPGLAPEVINRARERGVPVLPGAVTPTEMMAALSLGLTVLKFFPAVAFGGLRAIGSLASPFSELSFVPTGGVDATNMAGYLQLPNVPAVGGSWMVDGALIREGKFDLIADLCREAVGIAASTREEQRWVS